MRTKKWIPAAVVVFLLVLTGLGFLFFPRKSQLAELTAPEPSSSPSPAVLKPSSTAKPAKPDPLPALPAGPSLSPSPSVSSTANIADCQPMGKGFTPKKFTISRVSAAEKVIPLGLVGGDTIPAPPKSDRRSAAWWSGGPKPGADQGKAIFTIHTYRPSLAPALGNELFDGGQSQLVPGDLFKVYGTKGEVACYEFTEAPKINLAQYEENSELMFDPTGPAAATIIICWDFNSRTKDWDSRVLFQFRPVQP